MDYITLFIIAVGLAMDAFSVAVTDGITLRGTLKPANAFKIALFFGVFQAIMPCIGLALGFNFKSYIFMKQCFRFKSNLHMIFFA